MDIRFIQFNHLTLTLFKENFLQGLASQHKKILLITSFIFGFLAAYYVISRCCFKAKILNSAKEKEIVHLKKIRFEQVVSGDDVQPFLIEQISCQINSKVDENEFQQYLLSHPQLRSQNKILLENTLFRASCPSTDIHYHHFAPVNTDFNELLNSVPNRKETSSKISCVSHWFDYTDAHHFYIDFAHATSFGGAYRSYGCVQEERMFAEFRALALLDFKTQNGIHPCIDSYISGGHSNYPPQAQPFPFIIESIHRQFDISQTPYGGDFQKASEQAIVKGIVKVANPVPVNIMGLAAVDWRHVENPKYKIEDLIYHFEVAYLAHIGAKHLSKQREWKETVVHTAPWGCGAFLNSEKMMVALQYLAAQMADVDLVFHGVGNPMNPHYTQDDVNQVIQLILKLIHEEKSTQQILTILLDKSLSDSTWAPKVKV